MSKMATEDIELKGEANMKTENSQQSSEGEIMSQSTQKYAGKQTRDPLAQKEPNVQINISEHGTGLNENGNIEIPISVVNDNCVDSSTSLELIRNTDSEVSLESHPSCLLIGSQAYDKVSSENNVCDVHNIALNSEKTMEETELENKTQQIEMKRLFDGGTDTIKAKEETVEQATQDHKTVKISGNEENRDLEEMCKEISEAIETVTKRKRLYSEERESENIGKGSESGINPWAYHEEEKHESGLDMVVIEEEASSEEMEDSSGEDDKLSSPSSTQEQIESPPVCDSCGVVTETQEPSMTQQVLCAEGTVKQIYPLPPGQPLLQREKVFFHLSVKEQQETLQRLKDLQREAEMKCASDRRRQMLRFQERLSIARIRRSQEDLLGTSPSASPLLSPEPSPQGDTEHQKTAVREHLERVKRERTNIMQTKRERNTSTFRELLDPVLTRSECEDGEVGLRGTEGV
ncbi:Hypothetical predicted protein [Pelobates cultripes]|uniref:Uncharacterized protein n=1 Tax=Pelobates cultripes TaxID=61616 RepID=A0AAD1RQ68_PELCU|nr:Hypothetical predicted protein [Pelobates cultripes]